MLKAFNYELWSHKVRLAVSEWHLHLNAQSILVRTLKKSADPSSFFLCELVVSSNKDMKNSEISLC